MNRCSPAADSPGIEKKKAGGFPLAAARLWPAAQYQPARVFQSLMATAEAEGIPVQVSSAVRGTGTDANVMQLSRGGMATGLLSVPLRYMHTPNELLAWRRSAEA